MYLAIMHNDADRRTGRQTALSSNNQSINRNKLCSVVCRKRIRVANSRSYSVQYDCPNKFTRKVNTPQSVQQ